jgi:signal transduction histidine kinase
MWALRRSDLALVACATLVAAILVLLDDQGWPEWIFGTFMLACLAWLGRLGVDAWRAARRERIREQHLRATRPDAVAEHAVAFERARLAEEVETCIRESLREIAGELDTVDPTDPVPTLQRVHTLTRQTTTELRRQLGLLREEAESDLPGPAHLEEPPGDVGRRRDLTQGVAVAVLAAVESTLYLLTEGPRDWLPWSVMTCALAGATLALRRLRPPTAVVAFATVVCLGSLAGHPVTGGFWIVITLGVLLWSLAATTVTGRGDALARAGAAVLLVGVVSWAFGRDDPGNLAVMLVVIAVASAGGLLVGLQRWGQSRAQRFAQSRERVLDAAADLAVRTERANLARELHDVVSHAVGVVALQAGAAELSWPHDPEAVDRAVEVIRRTTSDALADLERLSPVGHEAGHDFDDLQSLVDRVRAAGTPVDLTVVGDAGEHAAVVHRIVQESLTNAMRHAPGAPVSVRVVSDEHGTVVSVSDAGPGPGEARSRGYGLVGLAERVEFARGTFETGPGSGGRGFRVVATLPHASPTGAR